MFPLRDSEFIAEKCVFECPILDSAMIDQGQERDIYMSSIDPIQAEQHDKTQCIHI